MTLLLCLTFYVNVGFRFLGCHHLGERRFSVFQNSEKVKSTDGFQGITSLGDSHTGNPASHGLGIDGSLTWRDLLSIEQEVGRWLLDDAQGFLPTGSELRQYNPK